MLPGLHFLPPVVEQLLGVQLLTEGVSVLFQLLSLHVVLPPFAQDGFHALEVGLELAVDLRDGVTQWQTCTIASVLAKELKSGAPPLLSAQFSLDVVERMQLKNHSYALIFEKAPLFATASG